MINQLLNRLIMPTHWEKKKSSEVVAHVLVWSSLSWDGLGSTESGPTESKGH